VPVLRDVKGGRGGRGASSFSTISLSVDENRGIEVGGLGGEVDYFMVDEDRFSDRFSPHFFKMTISTRFYTILHKC
jgi:hypothetical protein